MKPQPEGKAVTTTPTVHLLDAVIAETERRGILSETPPEPQVAESAASKLTTYQKRVKALEKARAARSAKAAERRKRREEARAAQAGPTTYEKRVKALEKARKVRSAKAAERRKLKAQDDVARKNFTEKVEKSIKNPANYEAGSKATRERNIARARQRLEDELAKPRNKRVMVLEFCIVCGSASCDYQRVRIEIPCGD